jgi:hypothetical protein
MLLRSTPWCTVSPWSMPCMLVSYRTFVLTSGPFPAQEGRAAAVTAWIPPIGPIVEHPLSEVNEPIGSPETFSVTTSAPIPRIPVSTSCSEPVLLRPDQVRASLMPTPVSRMSATHEDHVEGSESAEITSSLEPRFTPRSVINIPPEPVVNVHVQASRDPLSLSPRAHASTSISLESRMEDLINQVKVELQGLKLWKEEAISQLDAKVLSLTCDRVVDSASMNKVHEDLTERFSQLQIQVDSLATMSYVDQVQTNLTELIPTMVQNRPLTDQVTREEITKVRDAMQKVQISNMETMSNHTKSVLESLSLSYKVKTIEGRIKHVGEKAHYAHNIAVQAQSLVVGLQPQVQSNTLRITEIATSLEDLRTSVTSQVDTVMGTCKDLRELLIKHTSLPDVNNPSETIDLADVLSVLGPLLNEIADQIGKAISKADNAFKTAIDTMTNLSGLQALLETTNKRLDSDHSQLMEESEHNTLCLWQHVKLLRDHVDAFWRTQVGYPPEDTDGTVLRFVNFAPTCDALEFCTKFADYRTKVALASPRSVRRDPFSLPLPDSPVANTSDHTLTPFNHMGVLSYAQEELGHGSPDVQLGMPPMGIVRLSPVVGDLGSEPISAPGPMDVDTFSNLVDCIVNREERFH